MLSARAIGFAREQFWKYLLKSRLCMMNLKVSLCLFLVLSLAVGCSKPAPPPAASQSTESKDPEEAALVTVAGLYSAMVMFKKKPPTEWKDLEDYTSSVDSGVRTKAVDAINKLRSLNYQMKWGVDLSKIFKEDKDPNSYVIGESPDGRLKVTYSGKIIKSEGEQPEEEAKPATETAGPEEKKEE